MSVSLTQSLSFVKSNLHVLLPEIECRVSESDDGRIHASGQCRYDNKMLHTLLKLEEMIDRAKANQPCKHCFNSISVSIPGGAESCWRNLVVALERYRSIENARSLDFSDPVKAITELEAAVADEEACRYSATINLLKPQPSLDLRVYASRIQDFYSHLKASKEEPFDNEPLSWGVMLIENKSWISSAFLFRNMVVSRRKDGVFAQLCLRVFWAGKHPFDKEKPSGLYHAPVELLNNITMHNGSSLEGVKVYQTEGQLSSAQLEILSALVEESHSLSLPELVETSTSISPNNNNGG